MNSMDSSGHEWTDLDSNLINLRHPMDNFGNEIQGADKEKNEIKFSSEE